MSKSINLIRADLQSFKPYSSARDEAKQGKLWLNANESPWCDSQGDFALNRYPEKQPQDLIQSLSAIYSVSADQILMCRGSDEAMDLLVRLFCRAEKDSIMIFPPTFGMYKVCAQLQGAKTIEVPLEKQNNFQLNFEDILNNWTPEVKIIFVCSPNNPTGNTIKRADIIRLCETFYGKSIIAVDEAYIEYASEESVSNLIPQYDNLVVLRTFSKAYGLAGARCGLLLAQQELLKWITAIMPPYPLSIPTINAVATAVSSFRVKKMQERLQCVKQERQSLLEKLNTFSFVKKVWPSEANFLLLEVNNAEKIMEECRKQLIILRNMHDKLNLENCIRITVGSPQENKQLLMAMQEMEARV